MRHDASIDPERARPRKLVAVNCTEFHFFSFTTSAVE
jgi:hypothetical protein